MCCTMAIIILFGNWHRMFQLKSEKTRWLISALRIRRKFAFVNMREFLKIILEICNPTKVCPHSSFEFKSYSGVRILFVEFPVLSSDCYVKEMDICFSCNWTLSDFFFKGNDGDWTPHSESRVSLLAWLAGIFGKVFIRWWKCVRMSYQFTASQYSIRSYIFV